MLYYEKKGHWPLLKARKVVAAVDDSHADSNKAGGRSGDGVLTSSENDKAHDPATAAAATTTVVRNVDG